MREIIYIQAGNFSNHIGTHFWNAQESYFAYGEDADEPVVNHDISFREGLSSQNEQTYCPRLLLFDTKSNFGAMSKYNELYSDSSAANNDLLASGASWNGPVAEFKQNPIAKSDYQRRLEEGDPGDDEGSANAAVKSQEVRFWSDYNRVYYHPRSLHALSDLPEWEANKGDWNYGKSTFQKYEAEIEFSEGDFRHFIEECDNFQGFQMQFDNPMFGPFSVAMLEMIRDELPKIPVLAFPVLSGTNPSRIDVDEVQARKSVLLDALCLQTLSELASQAVPTQSPSSWQLGRWSEHIDLDTKSLYESSAVLSAHIESATLPLRLKHKSEDLSNLSQHLNWAQNTRISHLSGILPFIDGDDMVTHCHDFSTVLEPATNKGIQVLAQRNTTRGLSAAQRHKAEELFSKSGLASPYLSNIHSITYPLPSSYPHFFRPLPSLNSPPPPKRARPMPSSLPQRTSTPVISSLTTTTSTGHLFKAHARFLGECIRKRVGMGDGGGGEGVGLDTDELKEVRDALWALADAYLGAEAEADDGEGEEEEGSVSVEEDG